jgi:hypothetical protein
MPTAHVYLTEGFSNDHVIVRVDGRKAFEEGVTTKTLYGLAKEVSPVTLSGDHARAEIELPQKGLRTAIEIDLRKGTHIPISLEDGNLTYSIEKHMGFA